MTAAPAPDPLAGPRPKASVPPLDARAPRPAVVRLRGSVVVAAVMAASGLLAAALAWSFVVQPQRRMIHDHGAASSAEGARGAVHPSERVTAQAASYGDLAALPPPRRLGWSPREAPGLAQAAVPQAASHAGTAGRDARRPDDAGAQARQSGLFFNPAGRVGEAAPAMGAAAGAGGGPGRSGASIDDPHDLLAPRSPDELKAGAIIPAALLTAIDTARAGPVVATVTENIFDTVSGRTLLIPQGSRLIGEHDGQSRHGDTRAFLQWDRLILPNGKSLALSHEPGVDAQGAIGLPGHVDRRILPLAVATVFAGAITTLGQAARDHDAHSDGLLGDAGDAAAIQAAQIGGKLIDRELEVHPSIQLAPGARVQVLITHDLVLEPYRS